MLFSIGIVVLSVALGAWLALAPKEGQRHVGPIRTCALTAALGVVAMHLLPEAVHAAGLWALLGLAGGFAIPFVIRTATAGLFPRRPHPDGDGEPALVLEVSYAGLLAHSVGDGLTIGAYSGTHLDGHAHEDVVLAIAAHTVPVTTVFLLALAPVRGKRSALLHAVGLAVATVSGIVVASLFAMDWTHGAGGWVAAVLSGLLVHVVLHDLRADPPRGTAGRALDFAGAGAGIAVAMIGSDAQHGLGALGEGAPRRLWEALVELTLETAPMLLLGLAIASVLQAFGPGLPTRWLTRGRPFGQAVRGAVVGAPLPLCSCSVLPVSSSLRTRGAAPALVVAFLIATPELGVETLTLTGKLLGWPFAWLRVAAAILVAIVAGLVVAWLTRAPARPPTPEVTGPAMHGSVSPSTSATLRLVTAFDDLLFHVGAWTAIGLLGAAFVQALLPEQAFAHLAGSGADVLILSALSIPSYVCASSATPLGAVLIEKGFSPGAVLVGLLLGPATNVATLAFLKRAYGLRAALGTTAAILLVSWAFAYGTNFVAPHLALETRAAVAEHHHGPVAITSTWLLIALLVRSVWLSGARAWLSAMLSVSPSRPGTEAIHPHPHPHAHSHAH
jgi:uncharacterized protein